MAKYLPMLIAAILSVASAFSGPIQDWIAAHPSVTAGLAGVATLIGILLKSPVSTKP